MMMGQDKKKMLQIIIGKPQQDDAGSEEDAILAAKEDAFLQFSHAVKNSDANAGVEAFKTMYDLCKELSDNHGPMDDGEPGNY